MTAAVFIRHTCISLHTAAKMSRDDFIPLVIFEPHEKNFEISISLSRAKHVRRTAEAKHVTKPSPFEDRVLPPLRFEIRNAAHIFLLSVFLKSYVASTHLVLRVPEFRSFISFPSCSAAALRRSSNRRDQVSSPQPQPLRREHGAGRLLPAGTR